MGDRQGISTLKTFQSGRLREQLTSEEAKHEATTLARRERDKT